MYRAAERPALASDRQGRELRPPAMPFRPMPPVLPSAPFRPARRPFPESYRQRDEGTGDGSTQRRREKQAP